MDLRIKMRDNEPITIKKTGKMSKNFAIPLLRITKK